LAKLSFGFRRLTREASFLPICHTGYVGMREGELNPISRAYCPSMSGEDFAVAVPDTIRAPRSHANGQLPINGLSILTDC
jgi:hypothetical protein